MSAAKKSQPKLDPEALRRSKQADMAKLCIDWRWVEKERDVNALVAAHRSPQQFWDPSVTLAVALPDALWEVGLPGIFTVLMNKCVAGNTPLTIEKFLVLDKSPLCGRMVLIGFHSKAEMELARTALSKPENMKEAREAVEKGEVVTMCCSVTAAHLRALGLNVEQWETFRENIFSYDGAALDVYFRSRHLRSSKGGRLPHQQRVILTLIGIRHELASPNPWDFLQLHDIGKGKGHWVPFLDQDLKPYESLAMRRLSKNEEKFWRAFKVCYKTCAAITEMGNDQFTTVPYDCVSPSRKRIAALKEWVHNNMAEFVDGYKQTCPDKNRMGFTFILMEMWARNKIQAYIDFNMAAAMLDAAHKKALRKGKAPKDAVFFPTKFEQLCSYLT
ncbi:hypothetical protein Pelo_3407 [Pelomyxa schiedti]|nr:hypothetical protein Pelo_3407 [Pelomyxa schiedti]